MRKNVEKGLALGALAITVFFATATSSPDDDGLTPTHPADAGNVESDQNPDGSGDASVHAPVPCADLLEAADLVETATVADDGQPLALEWRVDPDGAAAGNGYHRITSQSGALSGLLFQRSDGGHWSLGSLQEVQVAVRGQNTNQPAWQGVLPVIRLKDTVGQLLVLRPDLSQLSPAMDGFVRVRLHLDDHADAPNPNFNRNAIQGVEVLADTWGAGFTLDIDALSFALPGATCAMNCPSDCHDQGQCDADSLQCSCDLGAGGPGCGTCLEGYRWGDGGCVLEADGAYAHWPNPVSQSNSDPWLMEHAHAIRQLNPRVLVLLFDNDLDLDETRDQVDALRAAFAEASRVRGWEDPLAPPQLNYSLARRVVDLRDGVDGRHPAPDAWAFPNSTLLPRRPAGEPGMWGFDYKALFGPDFARRYGFHDPADGTKPLGLCELVNEGLVHEVWVLTEGVEGEASMAEVLEMKPRYDAAGNRLPGPLDRCAGNGCFDLDVPLCDRSLRIVSVNTLRGPGCAMHSVGHGLETVGQGSFVPQMTEWFRPFAGFDLGERYGAPVSSLYELGCSDPNGDGVLDPPCVTYADPQTATLHHGSAPTFTVSDYDGRCGNVHFPPNATWHYDTANPNPVDSSCMTFGRSGIKTPVNAERWDALESIAPDCGGGFLTWWFQNMPAGGSGQRHPDGRPMHPVWPAFFY
jgi:hypothetical protein